MVDRLDLVDAARQFGTAQHRFESSIISGEVTLFGPAPALEVGAGKRPNAIFYDSLDVVEARWMYGGTLMESRLRKLIDSPSRPYGRRPSSIP
jgi:hypothetical protein